MLSPKYAKMFLTEAEQLAKKYKLKPPTHVNSTKGAYSNSLDSSLSKNTNTLYELPPAIKKPDLTSRVDGGYGMSHQDTDFGFERLNALQKEVDDTVLSAEADLNTLSNMFEKRDIMPVPVGVSGHDVAVLPDKPMLSGALANPVPSTVADITSAITAGSEKGLEQARGNWKKWAKGFGLASLIGLGAAGGQLGIKTMQAYEKSAMQKQLQEQVILNAKNNKEEVLSAFIKNSKESNPEAEASLLVGSAYTGQPFGHTALAVKVGGQEKVYDFGRYGNITPERIGGVTLTGSNSPRGEGILRVWNSVDEYLKHEKTNGAGTSMQRTTYKYDYNISNEQANKIVQHFETLQKEGKKTGKKTNNWESYKLARDYYAVDYNCTTVAMDGLESAVPAIGKNSKPFIDIVEGLPDATARTGFIGTGIDTPNEVFLPHNLKKYLDASIDVKVDNKSEF